jgi:hypothetical protein
MRMDITWDKPPRFVWSDCRHYVWPKNHPIQSTTKKALEAYNAPAPNFHVRFFKGADPDRVNEAMMTLAKLGVDASQIEVEEDS